MLITLKKNGAEKRKIIEENRARRAIFTLPEEVKSLSSYLSEHFFGLDPHREWEPTEYKKKRTDIIFNYIKLFWKFKLEPGVNVTKLMPSVDMSDSPLEIWVIIS